MTFLKTLVNRILSADNEQPAPVDDQYDRLERLRRNHVWIEVTVAKTGMSYQSMVLDLDIYQ